MYSPFRCLKLSLLTLLLVCGSGQLTAQTGPVATTEVYAITDLEKPPRLKSRQAAPVYPIDLAKSGITGQVEVEFIVDPKGKVIHPKIKHSTNAGFNNAVLAAVLSWKYTPGQLAGRAVNARMSEVLYFNLVEEEEMRLGKKNLAAMRDDSTPRAADAKDGQTKTGATGKTNQPSEVETTASAVGSAKPEHQQTDATAPAPIIADEGAALLRQWVQPEYPESAAKAKKEGRVMVEFVVELDGTVSRATVAKSSDPQFDEAALAAVRQWTFSPGIADKKPVAMAMRAPVVFRLAQLSQKQPPGQPPAEELPAPLKRVSAQIKLSPNPAYPAELAETGLNGRVELEFTVGTDGVAHAPKVLWTSHAGFVPAALAALATSQFEPAHQGPLPFPEVQKAPIEFSTLGLKRADVLKANHIAVTTSPVPSVLPEPTILLEPVYPAARLLAGESGEAVVEFALSDRAKVENIQLISATEPEYGAALLAAVSRWQFGPAMHEGARVPVVLRVTYPFTPPVGGPVGRLVTELQPGGAGVSGAKGLDQRLTLVWQVAPVYPAAQRAARVAGEAKIEFIIDHEGRVRLPRIVSASHEDFGWAAATAISQWVFSPPTRGGQPTDVRVAIPISFPAPKE